MQAWFNEVLSPVEVTKVPNPLLEHFMYFRLIDIKHKYKTPQFETPVSFSVPFCCCGLCYHTSVGLRCIGSCLNTMYTCSGILVSFKMLQLTCLNVILFKTNINTGMECFRT